MDLPEGPFLGQTPTIAEKTGDSLHFRPTQETEAEYIQDLRDKMGKLAGEIGLCDRILVAKNSPGFTEFIKAVVLKRDITRRDMEGCYGDDSMLRILQGRCQALTSMGMILSDT